MTRPKLSIGIVNYNSGYRLRQCVESIAKHAPSCAYEVVVVDNASTDGSTRFLEEARLDHVRLIKSPVNLLFTGAVNLAYAQTAGDVFLIMNADIVALPGSLDALVRRMEEHPDVGGVGGYTLDHRGEFERYVRVFPSPAQVVASNYFGDRAKRWAWVRRHEQELEGIDFSAPAVVPDPMSGCSAFRRGLFPEPPLDPRFGIFWSDAELARKIWAAGSKTMVFPDVRFLHDHDQAPRRVKDERSLLLVLDYLVGCAVYFRLYGRRLDHMAVKLLFAAGALSSLLLKHLPRALLGRESWSMWRARGRVLVGFLRERNELLEAARVRAAEAGFPAVL